MTKEERFSIDRVFGVMPVSLNLPEKGPRKALRALVARRLHDGITFLENSETFPNTRINELMALARGLFKHKIVVLNLTDVYSNLALGIDNKESGQETVSLLIPRNFAVNCRQRPTEQLGLMVKAVSRIQDSVNGRFYPLEESRQRADAYLAEFLITRSVLPPTFIPQFKEEKALFSFPEGLDSLPEELSYEPISLLPALLFPDTPHD